MKRETNEAYEAPRTRRTLVELEGGFMSSASIFDKENEQDDAVSITGHEVGNTADYGSIGWDESPFSTGN